MEPAEARDFLPPEDVALLSELDADDLHLANACCAVERELRADGFARVERVSAAATASMREGSLDERLCGLRPEDFASAARDLLALGWINSLLG